MLLHAHKKILAEMVADATTDINGRHQVTKDNSSKLTLRVSVLQLIQRTQTHRLFIPIWCQHDDEMFKLFNAVHQTYTVNLISVNSSCTEH